MLHTVVETPTFERAAEKIGLSNDALTDLINALAKDPEQGDQIKGSGGYRKVRAAGRGKGKSGGFRVITLYSGRNIPLFLITIYSKGELRNLSRQQINTMKALSKTLIGIHGKKK